MTSVHQKSKDLHHSTNSHHLARSCQQSIPQHCHSCRISPIWERSLRPVAFKTPSSPSAVSVLHTPPEIFVRMDTPTTIATTAAFPFAVRTKAFAYALTCTCAARNPTLTRGRPPPPGTRKYPCNRLCLLRKLDSSAHNLCLLMAPWKFCCPNQPHTART